MTPQMPYANPVHEWLSRAGRFLRNLANELSDQNAYQRHLAHHGATDSPQEWRRFCDHHYAAKSKRGRCC
jgi:hypothetical protein